MDDFLNKIVGPGAKKIEENTGDRYGEVTRMFAEAIEKSSSASGALHRAEAGLTVFHNEPKERAAAREALASFWQRARDKFVSGGFRSSQPVDEVGEQFSRILSDVDLLMQELKERDMSIPEMVKKLDTVRSILLLLGV